MDIETIIKDADLRVPNVFLDANKVSWLNEINNEFFDIVKIPSIETFNTSADISSYTLSSDIRAKNISKVIIGNALYRNMLYEEVNPANNFFSFDDTTDTLQLTPAPTKVFSSIVRYYKVATTTFTTLDLTVSPDAPSEYHWIYVLGLCERIAKTMNDTVLANNYANDYKENLVIAQQNYLHDRG